METKKEVGWFFYRFEANMLARDKNSYNIPLYNIFGIAIHYGDKFMGHPSM